MGGCLVGLVRITTLMNDRQLAANLVGPHVSQAHPAGVRGDDNHVRIVIFGGDVVGEHRKGPQVVDRAVEESLDLGGVQID